MISGASHVALVVKNPPADAGDTRDTVWPWVGMAPHSSSLAQQSPWAEKPGQLQSMGLQSQTHLSTLYDFNTWPRNFCTLFNVHWLISVLHIYIHFYGAILHLHDLVKFCQFLQCSWLSSSCYTETTVDGDLKQQTLFLTVLEAGKFKVKALAEWWDPASWFLSATFSLFSSHGWEQRHEASFLVSQVTRTLTPFIRAPIPVQNSSQSPSSHYHIGS